MKSDYIGRQFGNYRIVRKLASGNFGTVYLAEHLYLETLAAIKILHISTELNAQARDKFLHEARVNSLLQHPHIIHLIDFGIDGTMPYMVMDYVPNGTLLMLHPRGTRVPEEQIVSYVHQIASALTFAHGRGVIHRDVKPENILLNSQQELILSDFGIAVVQPTLDSLSMQSPVGTPLYMAPEQIQGKPCAASDQYALGVMVYEWLCGEPPFQGSSIYKVFEQHLHTPPASLRARLPHLRSAVEDTVLGALAKNPEHRFSSVQDFAIALEEAFYATHPLSSDESVGHGAQNDDTQPMARASASDSTNDDATQPRLKITGPNEEDQRPESSASILHALPSPNALQQHARISIQNQNRLRLLKRVRTFWITGVLEHSLHGAALMTLGLQGQPDAVSNPWQLIVQHPQTAPQPLPTGTRIVQVYDDSDGELLILGAPGSGKTTLLLELARDLLGRAEQDERHPLPMVFNLSSWSMQQQSLVDWLVEELVSKYQVPRKLGQRLVDMDQILPLLDGLDEVNVQDRTACIETINIYRQEHGFLPLVVCSRSADYLEQTVRVRLGNAVTIQPLSQQQVYGYLARAGTALQALQVALHKYPALRELTQTPLMLSMLVLTYANMPIQDVLRMTSTSNQVQQVVQRYVERMLTRGSGVERYSAPAVKRWLSWLAKQLQKRGQPFYIERMQPGWLVEKRANQRHTRIVVGIIFGLLGLFALGPISGEIILTDFQSQALFFGGYVLTWTLLFGFINGILYPIDRAGSTIAGKRRRWRRGWQSIVRSIQNGLLAGLLIGCPYGSIVFQYPSPDVMLTGILTLGGIVGTIGGLTSWWIDSLLNIQPETIEPAETLRWSWASLGRNLAKSLALGVLCVLLFGLLLGLFTTAIDGSSLVDNILLGLESVVNLNLIPYVVLLGLLTGGLTGGVSTTLLNERDIIRPNLGLHRSARHSVLVGIISVLVVVEMAILLALLRPEIALSLTLSVGPLVGLVNALRVGGIACIQHMVLRWLLWKNKMMPWRYARFLNYASERVLLNKVGGSYMFSHRFLLEYFAALK